MHRMPRIALLLAALLAAACKAGGGSARLADNTESAPTAGSSAPAADAGPLGYSREQQPAAPGAAKPAGPPANAAVADSAAQRMIIRTGTATVEVDSLEPAIARVQRMAQQVGGYVANTSMQSGSQNAREASMELKVPADRWDQVIAGLRPLGKVEAQTTSTEDVGEEYVDVSARVANARRLEQRLVELLATRTGKLEDVLAVERELARVREEIERFEGRLRYLRTRVGMSTLTVRLHEPMPVIGGRPGANPIVNAFREAWDNFVSFVAGLIAMLGWLLPLAVVVGAAVWVFRRFVRWRPGPGTGPGMGTQTGPSAGPAGGVSPPPTGPEPGTVTGTGRTPTG
jgi:hypothetical protein